MTSNEPQPPTLAGGACLVVVVSITTAGVSGVGGAMSLLCSCAESGVVTNEVVEGVRKGGEASDEGGGRWL